MAQLPVLIISHNDGHYIKSTIKNLKKIGFKDILVIDDASTDETRSISLSEGVNVVTNTSLLGFSNSNLKGIYLRNRDDLLICSTMPNALINHQEIKDFVEFAKIGNYSMLISETSKNFSWNISDILRNRFGLFLPEPGFELIYLKQSLLDLISRSITGRNTYIYLDFIKQCVENKLKFGIYPIMGVLIQEAETRVSWKVRFKIYRRVMSYRKYWNYSFPETEKNRVLQTLLSVFTGAVLIKTYDLLVTYLREI